MRRRGLALLTAGCILMLSGCTGKQPEVSEPVQTLAPAQLPFSAPDGDSILNRTDTRLLYLPSTNGLQLASREVRLDSRDLTDQAQQLLQALFDWEGDGETEALGYSHRLSLYGDRLPEISEGICTVNLASSALQLSHSEFYKTCVAIATTLCDADAVSFVNILVADQSVGMDITGNLPMGTLSGHPNENLPVLWEQMEAKRTPLGDDMSRTPLNSMVTLYTPLPEAAGIGCESRILTFEGQTPQQLAAGLIRELDEMMLQNAEGAEQEGLAACLLHDPVISELEDGGRLITLSLREDTKARMQALGTDLPCVLASLTCTLTTFIPGIAAVCVRVGDKPVTELNSSRFGEMTVLGGLLRRDMFEPYLMGTTTVFFARGGRLCRCDQPVKRQLTDSPRAQLSVLLSGPSEAQRREGIAPTLPENILEDDILGVAEENGTLLVNLSEGFRSEIQSRGKEKEMLLCYSMVNTLCENTGLKKVCFFFEGEQVERIAGEIYWAGTFCYNPGLSESDRG